MGELYSIFSLCKKSPTGVREFDILEQKGRTQRSALTKTPPIARGSLSIKIIPVQIVV